MANNLSPELLAQLFAQESKDPFLTLVTLNHADFVEPVRLVNNSENIISRGEEYIAFPMNIRFPVDDGETARDFTIEFDNVSLYLIDEIRSVVDPMDVTIELILASMPDVPQISQGELKIQTLTYNASKISGRMMLDNFLNTEMTSEKYGPANFPGLF